MTIKDILRSPHFLVELLLCAIIIMLLIKIDGINEIKVDSKGFVKNTSFNIALTGDGAVLLSDRDGKVILRSDQDSLKKLHSISISTIGNNKNNSITQGLLDSLVPSAFAGDYFQIGINLDGQYVCRWFDSYTPC
ncbi:MAG: hypothetical protein HOP02_05095 [Methylococcaceae bacterium]|nr:hypothetical protein [Methylococcaceae bacterium]